ncbi:hypothetical protein JCM19240_2425 [Vibrio maritimus]|uniref:Outer membrane protein beta-barrel domain-containing protein n=1 Tax=Vibrio maritimus TaxID=990268 RepID=A0A090T4N8_9VIBR|nr:hypothetical protein JCM19240_2425 [Vibrio maritimus]
MKKQTLALTLILGLTSGVALADDYSGFRVGLGAVTGQKANAEDTAAGLKTPKGYGKIEAGYDFNRVFSLNGQITDLRGDYGQFKTKGTEAKIEGEVGYAFQLGNSGWDIKPYVAAGVANASGNITGIENERLRGTYVSTAAGVRVTTPIGLYVDGRVQKNNLTKKQKRDARFADDSQAALSVGFKF